MIKFNPFTGTFDYVGTATSGSTVTVNVPVGTVDASNTLFSVIGEPAWVVSDSSTYFDGAGYTYDSFGGTIMMDIPPSTYIRYILIT